MKKKLLFQLVDFVALLAVVVLVDWLFKGASIALVATLAWILGKYSKEAEMKLFQSDKT